MKKPIYTFALVGIIALGMTACSSESGDEQDLVENEAEQIDQYEEKEEQEEPLEEENLLGNFKNLAGKWTVDAATAGIQMDLMFGEDMSFIQKMGAVNGEGTWEIVDETHIKIVTQNTKGQTWQITDLTDDEMKVNWKPDAPNPKIIPMTRVK